MSKTRENNKFRVCESTGTPNTHGPHNSEKSTPFPFAPPSGPQSIRQFGPGAPTRAHRARGAASAWKVGRRPQRPVVQARAHRGSGPAGTGPRERRDDAPSEGEERPQRRRSARPRSSHLRAWCSPHVRSPSHREPRPQRRVERGHPAVRAGVYRAGAALPEPLCEVGRHVHSGNHAVHQSGGRSSLVR